MPVILRCTVLGAAVFGIGGALSGLVIGLLTDAPTAWFAVFEGAFLGGVPGAVLGVLIGLLAFLAGTLTRRSEP